MSALDGGRLNIAACSLGGAQSALDKAIAYLAQRSAFGRPLSEMQALQFRIADMATELEAARSLLWRAAAALDGREAEAGKLCAMAKLFAGFGFSSPMSAAAARATATSSFRHREDRARPPVHQI